LPKNTNSTNNAANNTNNDGARAKNDGAKASHTERARNNVDVVQLAACAAVAPATS